MLSILFLTYLLGALAEVYSHNNYDGGEHMLKIVNSKMNQVTLKVALENSWSHTPVWAAGNS
jgi:hypothetical protein